jgi:hypothetical protein
LLKSGAFIMFIIFCPSFGAVLRISKRLLLPPEALDPVACELRVLPARFVEPRDPQPVGDGESEILLREIGFSWQVFSKGFEAF